MENDSSVVRLRHFVIANCLNRLSTAAALTARSDDLAVKR
jgi:hypothetical protein